MDSLPNELLHYAFTFLSQRYRARCATVCKKWHRVTCNPFFYRSIEIHSLLQLYKFIAMAKVLMIKNKPVGHFVQRLLLEVFYFHEHKLPYPTIKHLYQACPSIQSIDFLKIEYVSIPLHPLPLPSLPIWKHTYISTPNLNMNILLPPCHKRHEQLISLHVDVHTLIYTETPFNIEDDYDYIDIKKKDLQTIRFDIDETLSYQTPPHDYDDDIINDHGDIHYYGKILSLPQFHHLKKLSLDFGKVFHDSRTAIYEIDERTLLSIHQSCPALEELTLIALFMNISRSTISLLSTSDHQYSNNNDFFKKTIPTYSHLKSLTLKWCVLNQPHCYTFLACLYPSLITLNMYIKWYALSVMKNQPYQLAIFDMFTRFTLLKEFILDNIVSIGSGETMTVNNGFWPHQLFLSWLHRHPTQLKILKYPYELTSPKLFLHPDYSKPLQPFLFLNHLTTLEFNIDYEPGSIWDYILEKKKKKKEGDDDQQQVLSSSITTLKINDSKYYQNDFFISEWLNAFPKLTALSLNGIGTIKYSMNQTYVTKGRSSHPFSSHGMKRNHNYYENNHILTSPSSSLIPHALPYNLQVLEIEDSNIDSNNTLVPICQHCPKLCIIKLKKVQFIMDNDSFRHHYHHHYHHYHHYHQGQPSAKRQRTITTSITAATRETEKNKRSINLTCLKNIPLKTANSFNLEKVKHDEEHLCTIDVSHLVLDQLVFDHCTFSNTMDMFAYKTLNATSLTVNESSTASQHLYVAKGYYGGPSDIVLNCKSVDTVGFR